MQYKPSIEVAHIPILLALITTCTCQNILTQAYTNTTIDIKPNTPTPHGTDMVVSASVPVCVGGQGLRSKPGTGMWAGGAGGCSTNGEAWFIKSDGYAVQWYTGWSCWIWTADAYPICGLSYYYNCNQYYPGPDGQDPVCEQCPTGKYSESFTLYAQKTYRCVDYTTGKYIVPVCFTGSGARSRAGSGLWAKGFGDCQGGNRLWYLYVQNVNTNPYYYVIQYLASDNRWFYIPWSTTSACGTGYYYTSTDTSVAGPDNQNPVCETCPQGKYSTYIYSASYETRVCIDCPLNYVSTTGCNDVSQCYKCPTTGNNLFGGSEFCACPIGQFGTIGANTCTPCPAGQVGTTTLQISCTSCPIGYYASTAGLSTCTACPAGSINTVSGATTCSKCPAGQFSPSQALSVCTTCAAGKYTTAIGANTCISCLAGTANPAIGSTSAAACAACPVGRYTGTAASSVCAICPIGQFASAASQTTCTTCAAGAYTSAAGSSVCVACPTGAYLAGTTQTACTTCSIGQYTSATAQTACTLCAAGYYTSAAGRTTCTSCVQGTFLAYPGLTTCNQCPGGTWSQGIAASLASSTGLMSNGYQPNSLSFQCGADGASLCTSWQSTVLTSTYLANVALDNNIDTRSITNIGQAAYWAIDFESPKPIYNILLWDRTDCCWNREDGFQIYISSFKQTGTSFVSNAGNQLCYTDTTVSGATPTRIPAVIQCNGLSGQYLYVVLKSGATDYLNFNEISININPCTLCVENKYSAPGSSTSAGCIACPANMVSPKGSYNCRCNAGYSTSGSTCTVCPPNTYNSAVGSTTCTACPANTNSVAGSTSLASCKCVANFYVDSTTLLCRACTSNTVSPNGFVVTPCGGTSDLVVQCNSGYYGNGFACTACIRCHADALYAVNCTGLTLSDVTKCVCRPFYFGDGIISCQSFCQGCPAGKYGAGDETCTSCPYGTYGTVAALTSAASCIQCDSGYTTGLNATTAERIDGATACVSCDTWLPTLGPLNGVAVAKPTLASYQLSGMGWDSTICTWQCNLGIFRMSENDSPTSANWQYFIANIVPKALPTTPTTNLTATSPDYNALINNLFHTLYDWCCDATLVNVGQYVPLGTCSRSTPGTPVNCPAIANGTYVANGTKLDRCMDWQCNDGYYASKDDIARCPFYDTTPCDMTKVCKPQITCPRNYTWARDTTQLAMPLLTNASTNGYYCMPCSVCMNGSQVWAPCNAVNNVQCSLCNSGSYSIYTQPCTQVARAPLGYFVVCTTYTSTPLPTTLTTTTAVALPPTRLANNEPITTWAQGASIALCSLYKCPALASPSLTYAGGDAPFTYSPTATGNTLDPSTVKCATKCKQWTSALNQGWYNDGTAAANPCKPCMWRLCTPTNVVQYFDMNQCKDLSQGQCTNCASTATVPSKYTLPPNAAGWLQFSNQQAALAPTNPFPCDIQCVPGYVKTSNFTCAVCPNVPANAIVTGINCQWICTSGYQLIGGACLACPFVDCSSSVGTYKGSSTSGGPTCPQCQSCTGIESIPNAIYTTSGNDNTPDSCQWKCRPMYYGQNFVLKYMNNNPTTCSPCSTNQACEDGSYYTQPCTDTTDSTCLPCTTCGPGFQVDTLCSGTTDTTCAPCTNALPPNTQYTSGCAIGCKPNYYDLATVSTTVTTTTCVACADPKTCAADETINPIARCPNTNTGARTGQCVKCACPAFPTPTPTTRWCWTGSVSGGCDWACVTGYKKLSGACVAGAATTRCDVTPTTRCATAATTTQTRSSSLAVAPTTFTPNTPTVVVVEVTIQRQLLCQDLAVPLIFIATAIQSKNTLPLETTLILLTETHTDATTTTLRCAGSTCEGCSTSLPSPPLNRRRLLQTTQTVTSLRTATAINTSAIDPSDTPAVLAIAPPLQRSLISADLGITASSVTAAVDARILDPACDAACMDASIQQAVNNQLPVTTSSATTPAVAPPTTTTPNIAQGITVAGASMGAAASLAVVVALFYGLCGGSRRRANSTLPSTNTPESRLYRDTKPTETTSAEYTAETIRGRRAGPIVLRLPSDLKLTRKNM